LCVGAGGIGCELLKDLALSGFRQVQVIDLDTIDVSNLNRQLLFRSQHVGMAKCTVACQVATEMVPPVDDNGDTLPEVAYQAHHGNVCDTSKFNVPFVQKCDLVLNALDNVEARRRVNRLCLAANVPMIEAGTTGYLGQVTVIHKGSGVACYECKTQETQKVYPICTIRSTPSMPVHTIVWAKELYKLLFHSKVEESMLYEDPDGDEPSTYMEAIVKLRNGVAESSSLPADELSALSQEVIRHLYATEIQKQLDMDRYKAAKKTPTCLAAAIMEKGVTATPPTSTTDIWSPEESVAVLASCIQQAAQTPRAELLEEFDKDDDLAMRFVTAASNIRSSVFGIEPLQSLYSAKGIAGNIIPAIATTNAICAGLQVLQAFKILKQQLELQRRGQDEELQISKSCVYVNCIRNCTRNGLYLTASALEAPNPECYVCKEAIIPLAINVEEWTLEEFLQRVVKKQLGFEEPTLSLGGDFIWEEGDGAEDDYKVNLPKKLNALPCGGIQHGTVLEIDDNSQNLTIQVCVSHQDVWEGDEVPDFPFTVGKIPPKKQEEEKSPAAVAKAPDASVADDDDDVVLIDDDEATAENGGKKRSGDHVIDADEKPSKRQKTDAGEDSEVIVID
jgi:ubiquitin-like 1-activating enzyme E1 B